MQQPLVPQAQHLHQQLQQQDPNLDERLSVVSDSAAWSIDPTNNSGADSDLDCNSPSKFTAYSTYSSNCSSVAVSMPLMQATTAAAAAAAASAASSSSQSHLNQLLFGDSAEPSPTAASHDAEVCFSFLSTFKTKQPNYSKTWTFSHMGCFFM